MREYHKDQVLAVVKYYLKPELRRIIMREVPEAYNAWVGRTVMMTERVSAHNAQLVDTYVAGYGTGFICGEHDMAGTTCDHEGVAVNDHRLDTSGRRQVEPEMHALNTEYAQSGGWLVEDDA